MTGNFESVSIEARILERRTQSFQNEKSLGSQLVGVVFKGDVQVDRRRLLLSLDHKSPRAAKLLFGNQCLHNIFGGRVGGVADVVGIRCSAISGKLKVSDQAARSIG